MARSYNKEYTKVKATWKAGSDKKNKKRPYKNCTPISPTNVTLLMAIRQ
jgi:hypothetical protein